MRCSTIRINGAIVPAITVCELDIRSSEAVVDENPSGILITDVEGLNSILGTIPENIPDAPSGDGEYVLKVDSGDSSWVEPATPGLPSEITIDGSKIETSYGGKTTTINTNGITTNSVDVKSDTSTIRIFNSDNTTVLATLSAGEQYYGQLELFSDPTVINGSFDAHSLVIAGRTDGAEILLDHVQQIALRTDGMTINKPIISDANGSFGTVGQVLTSNGESSPATWEDAGSVLPEEVVIDNTKIEATYGSLVTTINSTKFSVGDGISNYVLVNSGGITGSAFSNTDTSFTVDSNGELTAEIIGADTIAATTSVTVGNATFLEAGSLKFSDGPVDFNITVPFGTATFDIDGNKFLSSDGNSVTIHSSMAINDGLADITQLKANGSVWVDGSAGTEGQVLTSHGELAAATWSDVNGMEIGNQVTAADINSVLYVDADGNLGNSNGLLYDIDNSCLVANCIAVQPGGLSGSPVTGFNIFSDGSFYIRGNGFGTEGQILTSHGSGQSVTWEDSLIPPEVVISNVKLETTFTNMIFTSDETGLKLEDGLLNSVFIADTNGVTAKNLYNTDNSFSADPDGNVKCVNLNIGPIGSIEYSLPSVDGTAGQTMTTDGSGIVSWSDPSSVAIGGSISGSANNGNLLFVDIDGNVAEETTTYIDSGTLYANGITATATLSVTEGLGVGFTLNENGTFYVNGSYGETGMSLVSFGSGTSASWTYPDQYMQQVCVEFGSSWYVANGLGYFDIPTELGNRKIGAWRIRAITAGTGSGTNGVTLSKNGTPLTGFELSLDDGETSASDSSFPLTELNEGDLLSVNIASTTDTPAIGLIVTLVITA